MPRPKKRRVGASLDPNYGLLNPLLQLALQNQLGGSLPGNVPPGAADPEEEDEDDQSGSSDDSGTRKTHVSKASKHKKKEKGKKKKKSKKDKKKKKKGSSSSSSSTDSDLCDDVDSKKVKQWWTYLGPDFGKWGLDGPPASVPGYTLRKNCLPRKERVRQLVFMEPDRLSAGLLSSLTEMGLEQLCYIITGLSPKTQISDLMCKSRGELKRVMKQCRDTKLKTSGDSRLAAVSEDLSNIQQVAVELGWEGLWAKPGGGTNPGNSGLAVPDYTSTKWNNGEVVVKTKDQLRSLALGPPGCPCTFGYRGAKHVMVIAGSTDGSIPEYAISCDEIFNGAAGSKKWWNQVAKLAAHEMQCGDTGGWAKKYFNMCARLGDENFQRTAMIQEYTSKHGVESTRLAIEQALAADAEVPEPRKAIPGQPAKQLQISQFAQVAALTQKAKEIEEKREALELKRQQLFSGSKSTPASPEEVAQEEAKRKAHQKAILKEQNKQLAAAIQKLKAEKETREKEQRQAQAQKPDPADEEKKRLEEEAKNLKEQEEKLKAEAEEAEKKRLEEDSKRLQKEADQLKAEAEHAEKKRLEEEARELKETEKKRLEEEAKRLQEEAEKLKAEKKRLEEEEAKKLKEQEEAEKSLEEEAKRLQEEAEKLKAEAEEAEKKRLEEEAKRLQEEAEKLKAEAEEAEKKRLEEEAKRLQEEAEKLKAEAEEAEKKRLEEEEARRLQKEAGKLKADAEEAEEKKLEEEAKRLQEEAGKLKAEAEEALKAKTEKERHTAEQEQERLAKVKAQMKGASKDELVGAPKFKKNETEEEKAKRINEDPSKKSTAASGEEVGEIFQIFDDAEIAAAKAKQDQALGKLDGKPSS